MTHDHPLSGHVGSNKLLARLRPRFYWKNMKRSVSKYLRGCSCNRSKARKGHRVGRTITFSHYGPLDALQIDLVGPFPTSKRRKRWWLTLIDRYTRTLDLVALPSKDADGIARAIYENWITRYGAPVVILSDNEFRTQILAELSKLV